MALLVPHATSQKITTLSCGRYMRVRRRSKSLSLDLEFGRSMECPTQSKAEKEENTALEGLAG